MSTTDETNTIKILYNTLGQELYDQDWIKAKLVFEPGRYDLWLLYGQRLRQDGDLEGAIKALTRATELRPEGSVAWLYLAMAYRANKNLEQAGHAWQNVKDYREGFPFNLDQDFLPIFR